jgi:hypothetical protein
MSADTFGHCFVAAIQSLIALGLLGGCGVLVHDVCTGTFKRWGYWRRLLSARADQFAGLRRIR